MLPRIEIAEVLSFRLKVPRAELDSLAESLRQELEIAVTREKSELLVSVEEGDSFLRFRSIGPEAVLTEISISRDERGAFFQKVLGALMVRHLGDLHVRLTWNIAARNSDGEFAEVTIARGVTSYPGLVQSPLALPPAQAAAGQQAGSVASGNEDEAPAPTPELREIEDLLARAKQHWDEYQRLKKKGR